MICVWWWAGPRVQDCFTHMPGVLMRGPDQCTPVWASQHGHWISPIATGLFQSEKVLRQEVKLRGCYDLVTDVPEVLCGCSPSPARHLRKPCSSTAKPAAIRMDEQ